MSSIFLLKENRITIADIFKEKWCILKLKFKDCTFSQPSHDSQQITSKSATVTYH